MKYLPKSIVGAVMAGAYLVLMLILYMVATFGGRGFHDNKGYLVAILFFILTLPLSWVLLSILDFLKETPLNILFDVLGPVILVLSILFNASVIYLLVAFVSKTLQFIFTKRLK